VFKANVFRPLSSFTKLTFRSLNIAGSRRLGTHLNWFASEFEPQSTFEGLSRWSTCKRHSTNDWLHL